MIDVHYFPHPDTLKPNADCHGMADRLYSDLEYVEVGGGLLRGTGMKHEIVDNVLHFFVIYNFHVLSPKPVVPKMQLLEQEGYIKHD